MIKYLTKEREAEYEEFLKAHKKGHFMQSVLWHKLKSDWDSKVILSIDDSGKIKGSISLLIRKVPYLKNTIIYSPRGPVVSLDDLVALKEINEGIRAVAKEYKSFVFKADPDILAENEAFIELAQKAGFSVVKGSKNFEGIQPRFVFRLDISGKTEDEVFNIFHTKTRYNIRLAQKKGVSVRIGNKSDLPCFHKIMVETGLRDKFVIRPLSYFENILEYLGEHARLYIAEFEGRIIAGTLAISYGDKTWYLYGASSNADRNVMPNYLLQWEMIKWAIENKCDIYDFRGVSGDLDESNPLYGLYRFKKGFNGEFTEFLGELQIVFSPTLNLLVDKGEKLFRELRRRAYLLKGKN